MKLGAPEFLVTVMLPWPLPIQWYVKVVVFTECISVSKIFGVIKIISVNNFNTIQMFYWSKNVYLFEPQRRYSVLITHPTLNLVSNTYLMRELGTTFATYVYLFVVQTCKYVQRCTACFRQSICFYITHMTINDSTGN